jgi:hypothetical protein
MNPRSFGFFEFTLRINPDHMTGKFPFLDFHLG